MRVDDGGKQGNAIGRIMCRELQRQSILNFFHIRI